MTTDQHNGVHSSTPVTDLPRSAAAPAAEPARNAPPPQMRKVHVLNVRVLVVTLVAVVVIVPAAHFWHKYQTTRIGDTLLARAQTLADSEDWRQAASYTQRYLQLQPDDAAARVRLARQYDQAVSGRAGRERVINLYYQALGGAGEDEQEELRGRLAELLLENGRFGEAKQEAGKLLERDPEDAAAHRVRALAVLGQVETGKATAAGPEGQTVGDALESALQRQPGDPQLAAAWANLLRQRPELLGKTQRQQMSQPADRAARADAAMNRLVAANPEDPLAYLARDAYRSRYSLPGAEQDRLEALKRGGDRAEVVSAVAQLFALQARTARQNRAGEAEVQRLSELAVQQYQRLTDSLAPDDVPARLALAELLIERGEAPRAIQTLRDGLAGERAETIVLRLMLAEQLIATDELAEAGKIVAGSAPLLERLNTGMDPRFRQAQKRSLNLLQAQLALKQDDPARAVELAVPIADHATAPESQRFKACIVLSEAYGTLAKWDQSAAALEAAARLAPGQPELRRAAGLAWFKANQPAAAARSLEQAGGRAGGDLGVALARARLTEQLSLPPRRRDWSGVESAIRELTSSDGRSKLSEPWQVDFLKVDYALVRLRESPAPREVLEQIRTALAAAEQEYGQAAGFWLEAALRYETLRRPEDTDRALQQFQQLGSDLAAGPVVRARTHAGRREYQQAADVLREALATRPASEHAMLRAMLVRILILDGHDDAARQQLLGWQQADPRDSLVVQMLADLEFEARNWEAVAACEQRLREMSGGDDSQWLFLRARRLLSSSGSSPDAAVLQEAAQLQARLQKLRPQWSNTHLLRGWLDEVRGDFERALQAYQTALKFGEQRAVVCERVVRVLYRLGRITEANEYLAQLEHLIPGSPDLSSLAISVAAQLNDLERAEALAKRAVTSRPQDPSSWLSYALILSANGHPDEAEQAFRKALELAPADVRVWIGLFSFYGRHGRIEQARQTLEQLTERAEGTPAQLAFIRAQCHAMLGEHEDAEREYRQALELEPDNVPIRAQWVTYILQRGRPEVEAALRELIARAGKQPSTQPVADNARRLLAAHLARRGNDQAFAEAMQLIEQSGGGEQLGELDRRLQAIFFAQRPNPDLERAEQLLNELIYKTKSGLDSDHLLLASVYHQQAKRLSGPQREKKVAAARKEFEVVCLRPAASTEQLLYYAGFLLDEGLWGEATPTLQRLDKMAAADPRFVLVRARWLAGQRRSDEIQPLVEEFAQRWAKEAHDDQVRLQQLLTIGRIYMASEQLAAAERWYRQATELDPATYPVLAGALLAQGRAAEAVQLCAERARQASSAESAVVLANVLVSAQWSAAECQELEPLLLKALADHPGDVRLMFAVANLRVVQERSAEAIEFYRRALRLRPDDTVTMNNLATLLAEDSGDLQQALKLVDRAIELSGQQPALLDTKAMILFHQNRAEEALPLLQDAAAAHRGDPRYPFHLAVVLHRIGNSDQARSALHAACENGLQQQVLTASDRAYLEQLLQQYPLPES